MKKRWAAFKNQNKHEQKKNLKEILTNNKSVTKAILTQGYKPSLNAFQLFTVYRRT
jgi:hypothetical protein